VAVSAYILIQTEVGKAALVAAAVGDIDGVVSAEVVSRVQMIDGITRTLTCPVVHL
jgi:NhaP-type Na+/H+ or K+/H+ antiporter